MYYFSGQRYTRKCTEVIERHECSSSYSIPRPVTMGLSRDISCTAILTLINPGYFQNNLSQGEGGAIILSPKISCIGYTFAYLSNKKHSKGL